ncbi:retrotransposon protein, putative, ty3-gypsy subclass [Tanacetum coccineum]
MTTKLTLCWKGNHRSNRGHYLSTRWRNQILPVGIVKDVEVHIGKLKLLNDFYVIDMKKDLETPLLVGRGFLATANAVIDFRLAKIAVGEGITRSVFRVKGVDEDEGGSTYWTTLENGVFTNTTFFGWNRRTNPLIMQKRLLRCHLLENGKFARDVELNI